MVRASWTLTAIMMGLIACSDSTGSNDVSLSVLLTDSPGDLIGAAVVEIGEISLIPADGPAIVLTDLGGTHDLLALQNGVTANLATLTIPAGPYVQLRMVVTAATVTLANGLSFNDGSTTQSLTVPSGAQTGIKINLTSADGDGASQGIVISQGETVLVVDFDVSQNFRVQGNPTTPAGLNSVSFTPAIRAVVQDVAGSIAGTVSSTSGASLAGITLSAAQTDAGVMEALQTATASAVADSATGMYTIRFLAPGTYTVGISVDGVADQPGIQVGVAENVTGVDFSIP